MSSIPDELLAIDIETASPHREPGTDDFEDTSYFELVTVGVGYQPGPDEGVETEVLFREGGWEQEATSDLLQRLYSWCNEREADAVLTHNGKRFDETHLSGWAETVSRAGLWPGADDRIGSLFSQHVDLNPIAVDRYRNRLEPWRDSVKLEDVCEWEGVPVNPTSYGEYELGELMRHGAIDAAHVTNVHIGKVLGEAYVEHLIRGTTGTRQFKELHRLLRDYTESDIKPLFELARRFDER